MEIFYHLSTKDQISIKDLVIKIANVLNISFDEFVNITEERAGKDNAYLLDSTKFIEEFGKEFEISIENGLEETIEWVKNHLDILLQQNLEYIHKE